MKPRKTDALDYHARFSRKWRSEGRTIAKLKAEGYVVFRIAHTQRRKHREFGTEIPREATLIVCHKIYDFGKAKIVMVHSGKALSAARKKKLVDFVTHTPLMEAEIWTWPTLAREPVIERI